MKNHKALIILIIRLFSWDILLYPVFVFKNDPGPLCSEMILVPFCPRGLVWGTWMSQEVIGSMVNGSMGYFTDPYKCRINWGEKTPLILTYRVVFRGVQGDGGFPNIP